MSKISVWTTSGKWSKEITGLDKVHLMKEAIQWGVIRVDDYREYLDDPLKDYEIDSFNISVDYVDEIERVVKWRSLLPNKDLSIARSFKMPLGILKGMQKNPTCFSPIYQALIDSAELPASVLASPEDYCLMFKFENE